MAKNSIRDYSATNSSNTDIQSIDISEGCSPAGINNAIREVMADLKDVSTGAVALESPAFDSVTGNLNVNGNVTADGLTVDGDLAVSAANSRMRLYETDTTDLNTQLQNQAGDFNIQTLNDSASLATNRISIDHATGDISFYEDTGTTAKFFWDASAESLGIGTTSTSSEKLRLKQSTDSSLGGLVIESSDAYSAFMGREAGSTGAFTIRNNGSDTLSIKSGNVGIGTTLPLRQLHLASSVPSMRLEDTDVSGLYGEIVQLSTGDLSLRSDHGNVQASSSMSFSVDGSEAMRIDNTRILMVGKTTAGLANEGHQFNSQGYAYHTHDSGIPLYLNRKTNDGAVISIYRDSIAGSIGVTNTYVYLASDCGIQPRASDVVPTNSAGALNDNVVDLGDPSARYDDVYATNGTIQTSDQNEKQQIAALTDAEMTAAKAISQLFKTFKWNSAVTEKGDAARTHTGVIAQDVQAAMTAAGLDAGDYAFFISSTWWETQTEVPAVEAVEAVYEDVVIPAVLDEDGNEVEAERTEQRTVTEAVEAVAAYTRTDTHDTAEEAPEGATERTRLGIRYPELLAFVGAATEQRLANIETRLAALEAN